MNLPVDLGRRGWVAWNRMRGPVTCCREGCEGVKDRIREVGGVQVLGIEEEDRSVKDDSHMERTFLS